jgi:hypothetical protein
MRACVPAMGEEAKIFWLLQLICTQEAATCRLQRLPHLWAVKPEYLPTRAHTPTLASSQKHTHTTGVAIGGLVCGLVYTTMLGIKAFTRLLSSSSSSSSSSLPAFRVT